MSLWEAAKRYYEERGLPWKTWASCPTGEKLQEEVKELLDELKVWNLITGDDSLRNAVSIREEIADVAICLAWIAYSHGTSVEECIAIKTAKDRGRGRGKLGVK